jgi:hypothetical protein
MGVLFKSSQGCRWAGAQLTTSRPCIVLKVELTYISALCCGLTTPWGCRWVSGYLIVQWIPSSAAVGPWLAGLALAAPSGRSCESTFLAAAA